MKRFAPLLVALVLALVASTLAAIRQGQVVTVLRPDQLEVLDRNALDWNPTTGEFRVTGGDPFGFFQLPSGSVPLYELRLDFAGPPFAGGWYVYPSPAHLAVQTIKQEWVVTARTEPRGEDHSLIWPLDASSAARVDFPDELDRPLVLQRAVFTSRFMSSASPVFVWMTITGTAALVVAFWWLLRPVLRHKPVELAIMVALVAAKFWMTASLGQTVCTNAMHDDKLFMDQGMSILAGHWLGDYWQLSLAKGPTYSIFLALSSWTGAALQGNEVLFEALAAALFVLALSPVLRRPTGRLVLFFALLFQPHAVSAELLGRVLRGAIQPGLTLLTLAGLIGLLLRVNRRPWIQLPWALLAGLAGGAFWYSREEGIWLAPTALLLTSTMLLAGWRAHSAQRIAWIVVMLVPLISFQAVKLTLRTVNQHHYGLPIGVDVSEGAFPTAYGAMLRVTQPDPLPCVPLTLATRQLIYPESPAFAELSDRLDGALTESWGKSGWNDSNDPRAYTEIRGGWFQWAIRQAVNERGYYQSAQKSDAYWQRVADEINAAVDAGRLPGTGSRHGFFPVWQSAYTAELLPAWTEAIDLLVHFTGFKADADVSVGNPPDIAHYADFLHVRPVLAIEAPRIDTHARIIVHRAFAPFGWPLTILALFATGWIVVRAVRQRRSSDFVASAILLSLWGGATALSLVVTLVHVTSFHAITGIYLGPAVPMIVACWVLAPCLAWCRPTTDER